MSEPNSNLVSYFCRHLVPIKVSIQNSERKASWYITAFVMSVDDCWFLVTAGHCLKKVIDAIGHDYKLIEVQLIDFLGSEAKHENPIPFVLDPKSVFYYYKEGEIDYGIIPLSEYYDMLLEKNKVSPLSEDVWKKQPSSPISYVLLGLPEMLEAKGPEGDFIAPTMVFVESVEEKPEAFAETDFPFFYGKVLLPSNLDDIRGMSGGPILAFQEDNESHLRYWVVALQSAWLRDSQFIKACPTYLLGSAIEDILQNSSS